MLIFLVFFSCFLFYLKTCFLFVNQCFSRLGNHPHSACDKSTFYPHLTETTHWRTQRGEGWGAQTPSLLNNRNTFCIVCLHKSIQYSKALLVLIKLQIFHEKNDTNFTLISHFASASGDFVHKTAWGFSPGSHWGTFAPPDFWLGPVLENC